jgi:hypothetical protein
MARTVQDPRSRPGPRPRFAFRQCARKLSQARRVVKSGRLVGVEKPGGGREKLTDLRLQPHNARLHSKKAIERMRRHGKPGGLVECAMQPARPQRLYSVRGALAEACNIDRRLRKRPTREEPAGQPTLSPREQDQ